ncbi:MAG: DUF1573 domain-containing protein [Planctomycetes bacterium]|nr:DUF1573 domain-containing protein [Planctomycetota bacterium]
MSRRQWPLIHSALIGFSLLGCTSPTAPPVPQRDGTAPVATGYPVQATIELGVVKQGESARLSVWVTNKGTQAVEATTLKTSCECLSIELSQPKIGAGERVLAHAHYDGAKEPDFVGSLHIEVELLDPAGKKIGEIAVPIEVIKASKVEPKS